MAKPRIEVETKMLAEARRLYEETDTPVAAIASAVGLGGRTFYDRLPEWGWTRRIDRIRSALAGGPGQRPANAPETGEAAPPGGGQGVQERAAPAAGPVSHVGKPCPGLGGCPERPRLVARLWAAAEQEVAATERYVSALPGRRAPEAAARRLGVLAQTLDRLVALDRKAAGQAHGEADGDQDERSLPPVDAEAWAEALAAKLDAGKA